MSNRKQADIYQYTDLKWRNAFDAMHTRAMKADKIVAEQAERIAELEGNQTETIRVIQSNCYDGTGASNDRLLAHMEFLIKGDTNG